ncbi:MAG: cupin domain-containing protein [Gaiellaceae bacterium]
MAYRIVDSKDFEGRRKPIRECLGVSAFGINQYDAPPGFESRPHDELDSGQEEVYIPLAGNGLIVIEEEEEDLAPGRYVFVPPEQTRQVIAGPDGLSYVVVGSRPGAYMPRS